MKKTINYSKTNASAHTIVFKLTALLSVTGLSLLFFSFLFLSSCEKKENEITPVIELFQPNGAGAGEQVHIDGTDFGTSGEVIFGDISLQADSWTDTRVIFTVPSGYDNTQQIIGLRIKGKDYIAGTFTVTFTQEIDLGKGQPGCWSSDGKRIFMVLDVNNVYDIYSISSGGGEEPLLLRHLPGNEAFLDISFTGDEFLYCTTSEEFGNVDGDYELYKGNYFLSSRSFVYEAGDPRTNTTMERRPAWNHSIYGGIKYAWGVYAGGTYMIYISQNSKGKYVDEGYWPRFNPKNGRYLAYNVDTKDRGTAIVIRNLSIDDKVDTLIVGKDIKAGFDWSVNGRIVYCKKAAEGIGRDLWVMNDDGTNNHALIATPNDESNPRWSPGGKRLLFLRLTTQDYHLFVTLTP